MLNIIKSEILKLKKDTMFLVGTVIAILMPVLILVKDIFISNPPEEVMGWVMSCCLVCFMVLSVLSGFIITNFMQREYQSGAMTNILTSSVSRTAFILAKLIVWFLWYFIMLVFTEIVITLGSRLIYPAQFNAELAYTIVTLFSKFGLLSFISFIPLLWVTVVQKKLFYPSILTAIGFTAALTGGLNVSLDMILPASILPWTAVSIASVYQDGSVYMWISLASVMIMGSLGLFLACFSFKRQDQ